MLGIAVLGSGVVVGLLLKVQRTERLLRQLPDTSFRSIPPTANRWTAIFRFLTPSQRRRFGASPLGHRSSAWRSPPCRSSTNRS